MEAFKKVMKEWIIPFALEILVVLLIIKFVVFLAVVPTGSMLPTVSEGSWHITTRMYNPEKNLKRGDIVVFRSDELDENMLKRCIGLPGEKVEIKDDGSVYINGVLLDEPYVVYKSEDTASFDVPAGCYLFFGDNRSDSLDARYWKNPYIEAKKIMGKARFTVWPLKDFGILK